MNSFTLVHHVGFKPMAIPKGKIAPIASCALRASNKRDNLQVTCKLQITVTCKLALCTVWSRKSERADGAAFVII